VADRQVVTPHTALVAHQCLGSGLKPLPHLTLLHQLGEANLVKDVSEPIVGIAGDSAVALCHVSPDALLVAAFYPHLGQIDTDRTFVSYQATDCGASANVSRSVQAHQRPSDIRL
jgi:hypothetical protein